MRHLLFLIATLHFAACARSALEAGDDIQSVSLRLEAGIVTAFHWENGGKYHEELTWTPLGGDIPEVIHSLETPSQTAPHWTLEAGHFQKGELCLLRGASNGKVEHWKLARGQNGWSLSAKAAVELSPLASEIRYTSLDTFEVVLEGGKKDVYEVTNRPRSQHPVYKEVLKNGQPHGPDIISTGRHATVQARAAETGQAPSPEKEIFMVREPSDHVTAISWWPGMTLKDALKHRRGGELRLAVHFWHGSDRTTFQAKALMEEQTLKQFLHPDDVIVLGVIDQPRQRRVESLPAVTGALQHR